MELKNGNIYDDYDYSCGGDMKWTTKITICLIPLKKILGIIYIHIWIYEPTNDAKDPVKGNNTVYL